MHGYNANLYNTIGGKANCGEHPSSCMTRFLLLVMALGLMFHVFSS
jgi:hypothetical protein